MAASVVSLSVQTGSGGFAVARQVAERLRFRYYDWEITSEAASRAGVSPNEVIAAERVPGFLERMMRRLGAVSVTSMEGGPGFGEPSPALVNTAVLSISSDDYRPIIERVVVELGQLGEAVIVGHASQYHLRNQTSALRVLIHGSPSRRTERLADERGIDRKRATELVKQSDQDRHEVLKRVYHFEWLDARMYDLTIDTDRIPLDYAVETIVAAAKALP
ncbi:MAG TPA: cytidylate kinase-like family protein [Dehalococcoidia bacterium]|nr:cytidylate kinase-like family protein [Dehalococcoidia bacterium]